MTTIPSSPAACLPLLRAHRSQKWPPLRALTPWLCGSLAAALSCADREDADTNGIEVECSIDGTVTLKF